MTKDQERLLAKLDRSGGPNACWPFRGARKPGGYGNFYLNGRTIGAHVAAHLLFNGPVPDGLEVDHRCHDRKTCSGGATCPHRRCANPAHVRALSHRDNDLRGCGVSATNVRKTHCDSGHEFTPQNTYRAPGSPSERHCLTCQQIRRQASERT